MLPSSVLMSLNSFSTILRDTPTETCATLLHTPERWARGDCLLLGVPPFKIINAEGPQRILDNNSVAFTAQAFAQQRVTLRGSTWSAAHITVSNMWEEIPHTDLHVSLTPIACDCMLTLFIDTSLEADIPQWLLAVRELLALTLKHSPTIAPDEITELARPGPSVPQGATVAVHAIARVLEWPQWPGDGLQACRFYNASLEPLYSAVPNHSLDQRPTALPGSAWNHTQWSPAAPPPAAAVSAIAAAFAPPPVNDAKRQKGPDGAPVVLTEPDHERAYKIQMRVTAAQREQLERIFKFKRDAKNCSNQIVRERYAKMTNASVSRAANWMEVRNEWSTRTKGSRPEGIHKTFGVLAVKELCESYKSTAASGNQGYGKLPEIKFERPFFPRVFDTDKDPYTTHLTETVSIEVDPKKVYERKKKPAGERPPSKKTPKPKRPGKTSPLLSFLPTPHSTRRRHPECLARFGSDLGRAGPIVLRDSPRVIQALLACGDRLPKQCQIQLDHRTNRFYFLFHYTLPRLADPDPTFASKRVVALDPGLSPFQHWISPTSGSHGTLLNVADKLKARMARVDAMADRLREHRRRCAASFPCVAGREHKCNSEMTRSEFRCSANFRHRTTRRLKHRLARERVRLHNWVERGHYDAAKFLLVLGDVVIAPVLNVGHLLKGEGLYREAKRKLGALSHCLFRRRLISASARYPGAHVLETREPGTSKTCTGCGHWHAELMLGDRTFECPCCGLCVDRQMAGARNNLLAAYGRALGVGWDGQRG